MTIELKDIQRLLDAFEASDWTSVHLKVGDVEVSIGTDGSATNSVAPVASAAAAAPAAAPPPPATPATPVVEQPPAPVESVAEHSGTAILAPSPGIFWRSPSPGAPPFTEVGEQVTPESTVCIVELMKLMNNVHAGMTGTVTAILVGNGEPVEMGQPILLVREA